MAFIEQITNYITEHYDLSNDNLTIVFPNKRAALQLRNELEKHITYNFWVPNIISIQQAMEDWSDLQLIDNIDVIFELIRINDSFHNNAEMNHSFFGLAAQMAKDFDEIDQYNVNAESLFNHLTNAKEIEDWNMELNSNIESNYVRFFASLIQYYNALKNSLQQNGLGYYGMITKKIASYDDTVLVQRTKDKKIIFAGFNALTNTEENIIVRLVEQGNAVMLWDLDEYYFNDEKQEAGVFARKFFKSHPNIEKNFIGNNYKTQDKEINVINVSGNSVQTNALQLQLNQEVEENIINNGTNSVIVLADESILIPTLNSIPDCVDKIQVTMGYPYQKTATYHFIDQLFRYQKSLSSDENKIYLWTFIRFCNSEFIKLIFNGKEVHRLNNWLNRLANDSQYYFSKSDADIFKDDTELFDFLNVSLSKWQDTTSCIESVKRLLEISMQKISDTKNNFIKNQISVASRTTNRIELLIRKYNNYIQIDDLQVLFTQVAMQSSIDLKGDSDGLQIMGLLETRNLDFDVIHFLSVNEGVLPLSKSNNSLIPFDIRKIFGLPTHTQQQAVYAYHFYRLLQNAKRINLYYNSLADMSGFGEPSRFIRQLEHEYARNNKNVKLTHIQYKSPQVNEKNQVISIPKTPEMIEKIIEFSPTSIGTYVKCPLQYYFRYVEGIRDNKLNEEIQVNVIGSIVHKVLENFYHKFNNGTITSRLFELVYDRHFEQCYQDALEANGFHSGLPQTGFNHLSKTVIDNMLANFLIEEKKFIKEGETGEIRYKLSMIDMEKEMSHTFNVDGKDIKLKGFADRIDKVNNTIRIIDYKTGKVEDHNVKVKADQTDITLMAEKSIQLLVYKYLYLMENPELNPDDIEPGIIGFLKLSNGIFSLNTSENQDFNNDFRTNCENYFIRFFKEVLNREIPFSQTGKEQNCRFCEFRSICKRS
ncbi:MAG: PD-(D/E)XK nuclease family protein [Bacteroidales bacterium]|nr:PD-(D/E)XK nuclease family protein [Bacteroidales bacterium]